MNGNNSGKTNVMLGMICAVLVLVLGAVFVADSRATAKEEKRLMKLAEDQRKGIEDYENVKKRAAELEKQSAETEENTEEETPSEDKDKSDAEKSADQSK